MKKISYFLFWILIASQSHAENPNVFLGGAGTPAPAKDPTQPVQRGYIVPSSEPIEGGAKLTVEVFQTTINSGVYLSLEAIVHVGVPYTIERNGINVVAVIPLRILDRDVRDASQYYIKREFLLNYAEINADIQSRAPNAKGLIVGPGTALFVQASFDSGHQWGGPDRGGVFFLPVPSDQIFTEIKRAKTKSQIKATKPTALDLGFQLPQEIANQFNDRETGAGLKAGGQVRSRVEGEGKYQLTEAEFLQIQRTLVNLEANPAEATKILGPEWKLAAISRYYQKDASGAVIKDANGIPIPDPMIDTYYDDAENRAAKKDMAIRYRWTEGNQSGAWNFKPGIGRVDSEGITYRVEYGLDTTDNKPGSIAKFIDSNHPLNPFQLIRTVIPESTPSSFLNPSVKLTDMRYKFMLTHTSGLAIEVSLDDVRAESIRDPSNQARFFQLEMDIDHLATKSKNAVPAGIARGTGGMLNYGLNISVNLASAPNAGSIIQQAEEFAFKTANDFLQTLGKKAFIDGRLVLHDQSDIELESVLLKTRQGEFDLATKVITAIRDHVIGKTWKPGAQKFAFAAALLKLVNETDMSESVKKVKDMLIKKNENGTGASAACGTAFQ